MLRLYAGSFLWELHSKCGLASFEKAESDVVIPNRLSSKPSRQLSLRKRIKRNIDAQDHQMVTTSGSSISRRTAITDTKGLSPNIDPAFLSIAKCGSSAPLENI